MKNKLLHDKKESYGKYLRTKTTDHYTE